MAATSVFPSLAQLADSLPSDLSTPLLSFEPFSLPSSNQRVLTSPHEPETVIPLALKPAARTDAAPPTLEQAIDSIKFLAKAGELDTKLARHGTLLFRDLPINDAKEFSDFAHAFGYKPHEIIGIVVDRPLLAPNVAPANEAAPETTIGSHNESPQVPHAPAYIFFYGHVVAEKGGETPIGSSLEQFRLINEEIPEFITELAEKGVLHTIIYKPTRQYKGNSTIFQAFGREIVDGDSEQTKRAKIEAQIRRFNRDPKLTSWTWDADGGITVKHILPAIRTQPGTGYPALFTNLAAAHAQRLKQPESDRQKVSVLPKYGDGTDIPDKYLDVLLRVTDETRVLHKWQRGDVLVFDNRIAQHGREAWEGEQEDRRVFASLWDGELPGPYNDADFATVNAAIEA